MNSITTFCFALLLITATLSFAARLESDDDRPSHEITSRNNKNDNGGAAAGGAGMGGGFFGSGTGFDIPGFGNGGVGGGYGAGYGGPAGGYSRGGIIRPTVVCREKGTPCYKKKLTCPAKCFSSYSRSGKGYGGGGGGGGCTIDCKKKCIAYC